MFETYLNLIILNRDPINGSNSNRMFWKILLQNFQIYVFVITNQSLNKMVGAESHKIWKFNPNITHTKDRIVSKGPIFGLKRSRN